MEIAKLDVEEIINELKKKGNIIFCGGKYSTQDMLKITEAFRMYGYKKGFKKGLKRGTKKGYSKGYDRGYAEGYSRAEEIYNDDYNDDYDFWDIQEQYDRYEQYDLIEKE